MKTLRILTFLTTLTCAAMADGKFDAADTTASALKKQLVGRDQGYALLRMKSGEKIVGKLEAVGDKAAHVTALSGMELFEAVVSLDEISAVVFRSAK